jgi:hypothetical protein
MTHVNGNDTSFDNPEGQFKQSINAWTLFFKDSTTFFELWMAKQKSYKADNTSKSKKTMLNLIYFEEHVEFLRQN